MTHIFLDRVELTGTSNTMTFSNISQEYTDLVIYVSAKTNGAEDRAVPRLYFNGDSTLSNYRYTRIYGIPTVALGGDANNADTIFTYLSGGNIPSNIFGSAEIYIPNYRVSAAKTFISNGASEGNISQTGLATVATFWNNNSAVTSITLVASIGQFTAGSTAYLYGIKRAGDYSTNITATGGSTILNLDGYKTHIFEYTGSDQTFNVSSVSANTEIEMFLWGAAGGGSNAEGFSDPGGPGGYTFGKSVISSPGSYIVQVGQGGGRTDGGSNRPGRSYPNAGLPSVRGGYTSGSGGGRSAIFVGSVSAANALIIAGGGGGAAGHGGGSGVGSQGAHGGSGNGNSASNARGHSPYVAEIDNGATTSSGGTTDAGSGNGGSGQLRGADAGNGTSWSSGGWNAAGGGGDGWYGGGSVVDKHQGGGGGSGYTHPTLVTNGSIESRGLIDSARQTGSILPPQTNNLFYISGVGTGNVNATGGNGLVVIRYRYV